MTSAMLFLQVSEIFAAEWRVKPRVTARETYTDNVRLAAQGAEQSDWITEVVPGVNIVGRGRRLEVDADYALSYRAYTNNDQANGHVTSMSARALLDAWDRKLFVRGTASVAQQNISTLGALPASDVNLSASRTEVRRAELSPYWVSRFGNVASARAQYDISRSEADGAASVLSTDTRGVNLSLSSGSAFGNLGWTLGYKDTEIQSSSGQFSRRETESHSLSLRYRVRPSLSLVSDLGRDHNTFGSARGTTGGSYYSVGFDWRPSARTKVAMQAGERYYGKTALVDLEHRTRLTTWQLNYSEQIVATPGQFTLPASFDTASTLDRLFTAQIPDPVERQQVVAAYILQAGLPGTLTSSVDFLTNQVSLVKQLQGVFGMRGPRGSLLVTLFRTDRDSQTTEQSVIATDPFSLSASTTQTGYSTILTWRLTEATSTSAGLTQQRIRLIDASREDTNSTLRLGVTHRFGTKLSGSVDYRWLDRDSSAPGANVRENALVGSITMAF